MHFLDYSFTALHSIAEVAMTSTSVSQSTTMASEITLTGSEAAGDGLNRVAGGIILHASYLEYCIVCFCVYALIQTFDVDRCS